MWFKNLSQNELETILATLKSFPNYEIALGCTDTKVTSLFAFLRFPLQQAQPYFQLIKEGFRSSHTVFLESTTPESLIPKRVFPQNLEYEQTTRQKKWREVALTKLL